MSKRACWRPVCYVVRDSIWMLLCDQIIPKPRQPVEDHVKDDMEKFSRHQLPIKSSSLLSPLIQLAWVHNKTTQMQFGLEKQSFCSGRE